jgi:carbon storage regulator
MLVLSRKVGERVMVGDKVVVTVVRIGPNAVRLGIEAPKEMNIVRDELCDYDGAVVPEAKPREDGAKRP